MSSVVKKITSVSVIMVIFLACVMILGLCFGSSGSGIRSFAEAIESFSNPDSLYYTIIWKIRFPRVLIAAMVGATLSLGGLVFQALMRNPLAEPYILGISGGSAIGAIIGILLNLSRFPGVSIFAFIGGKGKLFLVLIISN
jgi:iron complex transport system permease protein